MNNIKVLFLLLITFCLTALAQAQEGYRIDVTLNGLPNKNVMLAYYFNESTYTRDTSHTDSNGRVVWQGAEKLRPGVYIMVLTDEKQKMFDFAVYDDQHFSLHTNSDDFYRNMKVEGDINNELFFKNLVFNGTQNEIAGPMSEILADSTKSEQERAEARAKLEAINNNVKQFQEEILNQYPNTLVAKILTARKTFEFPQELAVATEENRDQRYYYYKEHFWDNIDLSDDALLRLPFPMMQQKIDEYFDRVVYQDPDSLIHEIEVVVNEGKDNSEMYKYLVWALTSKYYAPPVMGLDKVFVHLNDKYFASGQMDFWADEQLKKNVKDRADQLRLSMLGMKAPNLRMLDTDLRARSMYDITNKYTVLYFYDPDCGHCKEETPKLVDFYNKSQFDLQVFSICADTSMVKMRNYIKDMGMDKWVNVNGPRSLTGNYQDLYDAFQTPTLYILDEKKEIIAKKLPAERLMDFLQQYEAIREEDQ